MDVTLARYTTRMNSGILTKAAFDALASLKAGERLPWPTVATVLNQVDRKAAWRQDGAASFTDWIQRFGAESGMGIAMLWRSLSALRFYEDLRRNFPELVSLPPESLGKAVTPDHLDLLAKLWRVMSPNEFRTQLEGVLSGKVNRTQLRDTWRAFRPALRGRTARGRGQDIPTANPEDPQQYEFLLEARLYQTLASAGPAWTGIHDPNHFQLILGAAPVRVGGVRERDGLDAVCVVQKKKRDPLLIEGIIFAGTGVYWHGKVESLASLAPYCDHLWLVVPEELSDAQIAAVPAYVGIIAAIENGVRTIRVAGRPPHDSAKREALLMGLIIGEIRDQ